MKRIIVIGGTGFFGGLIAERLRATGLQPLVASRSRGDFRIDVDSPQELRAQLKLRDIVIDTAGPFHRRSLALIDAATRIGCDVVDISESSEYARQVYEREQPIRAAGIRVLTSCSTLSTLSAAVVRLSGLAEPQSLVMRLVPASRHTANEATATALLESIRGRAPGGALRCDSSDAETLPRIWPSLSSIEFAVNTKVPGFNALLLAAPKLARRLMPWGIRIMRAMGPRRGWITYRIESAQGNAGFSFSGERSYLTAVVPAVLAARLLAEGRFPTTGLIPPDQHVDAKELILALEREGVTIHRE